MLQEIISTEYDGKPRKLIEFKCSCGIIKLIPKHTLKERKYCSNYCKYKGQQNKVITKCALCQKEISLAKSKLKPYNFCNRLCKENAQSLDIAILKISHYKNGRWAYREKAFKMYGAVCKKCGYFDHQEMLDVDHIDSNRSNNRIENLQVLCVWCHALKTRLGL